MTQRRLRLPHYGWVIVAVALAGFTLMWAGRATFGLFYVAMVEEFQWSRATGTIGFSVSWLLVGLFSPLAGQLVDRAGARPALALGMVSIMAMLGLSSLINSLWQYTLFFGVFLAAAHALVLLSTSAVVARWFKHRRGTAMGVLATGYSIGPLLLFPLLQWSISGIGWRSTLAVGIVLPLALLPLVWLLVREQPPETAAAEHGSTPRAAEVAQHRASQEWTLRRALTSGRYWALFFLYVFGFVGYQIMLVHQVARADELGYARGISSAVFSLAFAFTLVGSLLGGWVSDRLGREMVWTLGSLGAASGLGLLALMPVGSGVGLLVTFAVVAGFGFGLRLPMLNAIPADVYGGASFGRIYGSLNISGAIGATLGPWVAGYLYDVLGNYTFPLLLGSLALVMAGVLVWVVRPSHPHRPAAGHRPPAEA